MSEEAKKESSKKDVTGDESPKKRLLASADGVSVCEVQVLTAAPGGNSACTAGNPLDVTEMTNYVDKEHGSQDETRDGPPKKKRTADGISTQRSELMVAAEGGTSSCTSDMNLLGAKDSEQDIEKEIMDQGITPDGEGPASKKRLRATADGNGANKKSYLPMRISSAIAEDERASEDDDIILNGSLGRSAKEGQALQTEQDDDGTILNEVIVVDEITLDEVIEDDEGQAEGENAPLVQAQSEVTRVPPPLDSMSIDIIVQIFGWMSLEDLARTSLTSRYLLAIAKMASLRGQLRTQHTAGQQAGPFLGVIIQRGAQIYLRPPHLKNPLKSAALSLRKFLLIESGVRTNFILRDCRDGRMLMSTDQHCTQFVVCSPFEEHLYNSLPICPELASDGEDFITAAFLPDDATHQYTVIVLAVRMSNRSEVCLKKFESKANEWFCALVECAFQFPERSMLRTASVFTNQHMNILNLSVGVISVNIWNLTIRTIPLPEHDVLTIIHRRHQMICRTRDGELCLLRVRVRPDIPGRSGKSLSVYVFDSISQEWNLKNEWPAPNSIPCLNLVGFAEGHGTAIVGTGWDSLYVLSIEDCRLSQEMSETGAGSDVLTYEIEYPSISWWDFSG